MKVVGEISWTVQPGYPKLTNSDGSLELAVNYLLNEKEIGDLPEDRGAFLDSRFPAFHGLGLILKKSVLTPRPGYRIWLLELNYATPSDSSGENPDLDETIEFDTDEYEEPLRQVPGYRTHWDHVLLMADDSPVTVYESWWNAATNTVVPDSARKYVKWARPDDAVPEGWSVLRAETKPGVTGRLTGAGVVTVVTKATRKSAFTKDMQHDYTRQTPPDTFGLGGQWLRCGSSIRKEGKLWCRTVKFRIAKAVDRDLYS